MRAVVELPAEFHGPVAYFDRWLWLALLGLLTVVLYYAAVLWFTRGHRTEQSGQRPADDDPRSAHLGEIDQIEHSARRGEITLRDAHQQLSEVVRGYVAIVTPLPARTMSLADFKAAAPGELATAIEVMYPPEFAPDHDGGAHERFDVALHHARSLVTTWS